VRFENFGLFASISPADWCRRSLLVLVLGGHSGRMELHFFEDCLQLFLH